MITIEGTAQQQQQPTQTDPLAVTASVAGTVANILLPGSGAMVEKVVNVGGNIISGIVTIFKNSKESDPTKDPEFVKRQAEAAAELERLMQAEAEFQAFLGSLTDADRTFSTMRKSAKMRGEEGTFFIDNLSGKTLTYAGKSINIDSLNYFKPLFEGGFIDSSGQVQTGGTKEGSSQAGMVAPGQEMKTVNIDFWALAISIGSFFASYLYYNTKPSRAKVNRRRAAARARAAKAAKRTTARK